MVGKRHDEGSPRPRAAPASGRAIQCLCWICWMLEAGGLEGSGWGSGTEFGLEFVTSPHRTAPHHMPACMANGEIPATVRPSEGAGEGMVMGSTLSGLAIRSTATLAVDLGVGDRVPVLA
jgi:hypothetical protein